MAIVVDFLNSEVCDGGEHASLRGRIVNTTNSNVIRAKTLRISRQDLMQPVSDDDFEIYLRVQAAILAQQVQNPTAATVRAAIEAKIIDVTVP